MVTGIIADSAANRLIDIPSHNQSVKEVVIPQLEGNKERLNIQQKDIAAKDLDPEKMEKLVESFNKVTESLNHQLKFEFNKDMPTQPIVKIVDRQSGKVIKEIPPKEFVEMVARMKDFIGNLFDKKA